MDLGLFLKLRAAEVLSAARRWAIGPHAEAVLAESFNGRILVDPEDMYIGRRLCFRGEYERKEITHLLTLVSSETRVLVVGSHVGTLAVPLAKKAKSLVAIEANPRNFRLLERNLLINEVRNAHAYNVAAMAADGEVEFLLPTVNTGGGKIFSDDLKNRKEFVLDTRGLVSVPGKALDSFLPGEKFDLLILDIEGAEYQAMCGMPRILDSVQAMVIEALPNHLDHVAHVSAGELLSLLYGFKSGYFLDEPDRRFPFAQAEFEINALRTKRYYDGRDLVLLRS